MTGGYIGRTGELHLWRPWFPDQTTRPPGHSQAACGKVVPRGEATAVVAGVECERCLRAYWRPLDPDSLPPDMRGRGKPPAGLKDWPVL